MQALEKLSHEHPQAVLRQGGLVAVLSYLDFFQTGVQRVAVATAATMCRSLTTDNIDAVSSAVPILTNLLQYQVRGRFHMHIYITCTSKQRALVLEDSGSIFFPCV